ncbi:hypothetical protein ACO1I7_05105, partial [Staphylococcus aureus]
MKAHKIFWLNLAAIIIISIVVSGGMFLAMKWEQIHLKDGLPVVNLKSSNLKRGELITGDFDKLIYGIPQLIEYKIDETA